MRDSLRPTIEPTAFANKEEAMPSCASMLRAFRRCIAEPEVSIFTLGLTEGWENAKTGQCYPMCPGTGAGQFDADQHVFRHYTYPEIRKALDEAVALMWGINPELRIRLTVSPVPLTAMVTEGHVLAAMTYSKSTLRAVAGGLAASAPRLDCFPSYEIISGAPARAGFFEPHGPTDRPADPAGDRGAAPGAGPAQHARVFRCDPEPDAGLRADGL